MKLQMYIVFFLLFYEKLLWLFTSVFKSSFRCRPRSSSSGATRAAYVILHFSRSLKSFRSIVTGFVSCVTSANSATGIWLITSMLIGMTSLATFLQSEVGDGKTNFGRSFSQQSASGQNAWAISVVSGTDVVVSGTGISMTSSFFWIGGICTSCSRRGDSQPGGKT